MFDSVAIIQHIIQPINDPEGSLYALRERTMIIATIFSFDSTPVS